MEQQPVDRPNVEPYSEHEALEVPIECNSPSCGSSNSLAGVTMQSVLPGARKQTMGRVS